MTNPTHLNDDGGLENLMNSEKFNLFPTPVQQKEPQVKLLPDFDENKIIENLGVIMRYSSSEYQRMREGKTPDSPLTESETALAVINELAREIITGKYS